MYWQLYIFNDDENDFISTMMMMKKNPYTIFRSHKKFVFEADFLFLPAFLYYHVFFFASCDEDDNVKCVTSCQYDIPYKNLTD